MSNPSDHQSYTAAWPYRWAAQVLSYIFHPVFVPVYFIAFLLYEHPTQYLGFSAPQKLVILLQSFLMFSFFPLVTVGLLKALGFIRSIHLQERKDRIIPLVASGIWYFWIWYVWHNIPDQPAVAVQFALGVWITSVLALMLNTRMKISLHAMSLGCTLALLFSMAFREDLYYGVWLSVAILVTGSVLSARLVVSDHRPGEVYWGLLVGSATVLVAGLFV